jgi:ABC-type Mn2+/Zn2+ transport system permease subunit
MDALYDIPRQFIMGLADEGVIHYTFLYAFVVNGLLCAVVIGPLLGGIGTRVVAKRMAFFSQAVGHAALTGVAIGVIIGESYTAPYVLRGRFIKRVGAVAAMRDIQFVLVIVGEQVKWLILDFGVFIIGRVIKRGIRFKSFDTRYFVFHTYFACKITLNVITKSCHVTDGLSNRASFEES